jgi:hypothetical protein
MPHGSRNWLAPIASAAMAVVFHWSAAMPAQAGIEVYQEQNEVAQRIQEQLGPDRSFALVIGISEFDHWNPLSGVTGEAEEVKRSLRAQGFEIDSESRQGRVTAKELDAAIEGFLRRRGASAENRLVVYVATHGAREIRDDGGYGLLIASDSEAADSSVLAASAYSVKQLSLHIEGKDAQHIFFFFNACFSGAMVPETRGGENPGITKADISALSWEAADWTLTLLAHNARLVITTMRVSSSRPAMTISLSPTRTIRSPKPLPTDLPERRTAIAMA